MSKDWLSIGRRMRSWGCSLTKRSKITKSSGGTFKFLKTKEARKISSRTTSSSKMYWSNRRFLATNARKDTSWSCTTTGWNLQKFKSSSAQCTLMSSSLYSPKQRLGMSRKESRRKRSDSYQRTYASSTSASGALIYADSSRRLERRMRVKISQPQFLQKLHLTWNNSTSLTSVIQRHLRSK